MYEGYLAWELNYSTMGVWGRFLYSIPFMLGTFVGAFLYAKSLKKRRLFWLRCLLCLSVGLVIAYLIWNKTFFAKYSTLSALLKYFILFALNYASMLFCFRCSGIAALFFCESGVASFSIVKILFDLVGLANAHFAWQIEPYGFLYSLIYFALAVIVYLVVYLLFGRKIHFTSEFFYDHKKIVIPSLSILLISTLFNILLGRMIYRDALMLETIALFKVLLLICCLFVIFFNFDTFQIGKQKAELEVIEQLNRQQLEQFCISKETIENVNLKYHDLKGQIAELTKLAGKEKIGSSLEGVKEQIKSYETIARTGNDTLDVILTEKAVYCEKNGIVLNYMADGEKLFFLETMDLVSLFGNLLSNAIEAVRDLSEEGKRIITLSVVAKGKLLFIECENYTNREITFKNGLPETNKEDKLSHGYGLKSIRLVAKKYGGTFQVGVEDCIFKAGVILPIPDEKS